MADLNAYVVFYFDTLREYWSVSTMFYMINKSAHVEVLRTLIGLIFNK